MTDMTSYKNMIDTLFFGARNTTFSIPDRYRLTVMKGMLHFAMEQLNGGSEEEKTIIYAAYEKWTGEPYSNDSDDDDD
jgi:hypothetical protein